MLSQITGNTILEILDYKIFCGCMLRNPPPPLVMPVPPPTCQDENQFILYGHVNYETIIVLKCSNSRWCVLVLVFLNIMFSGYTLIFIIIGVSSEIIFQRRVSARPNFTQIKCAVIKNSQN